MTDFAALLVADRGQKTHPIHLVDKTGFDGWVKKRPAEDRALLAAQRFDGKRAGAFVLLPRGGEFEVLEGPWTPSRLVLLKFPSRELAKAFYNSETYTHARKVREGAGVMRMIVVDGV